ncbi:TALE protein [Artemisia annua]|uniref:TALE protein n=1 Tax=Artemisia annua TaxID=35608 RepID=A0A2U1PH23_ARTAN|nr:TALE protein [Artemisia annua]
MFLRNGSAKPYTAVSLRTISRHFRSLRDLINGQIYATHRSLGETDSMSSDFLASVWESAAQAIASTSAAQNEATTCLETTKRASESFVTILRAWLFGHFLHP